MFSGFLHCGKLKRCWLRALLIRTVKKLCCCSVKHSWATAQCRRSVVCSVESFSRGRAMMINFNYKLLSKWKLNFNFVFCWLAVVDDDGMREAWASSSSIWKWGYLSNVLCDEINERWENTEHGRTEYLFRMRSLLLAVYLFMTRQIDNNSKLRLWARECVITVASKRWDNKMAQIIPHEIILRCCSLFTPSFFPSQIVYFSVTENPSTWDDTSGAHMRV